MEIIENKLDELNIDSPSALALGFFDGLHVAHCDVISSASLDGCEKAVVTFKEDPSLILSGKTEYLITDEDKSCLLEELSVKKLVKLDFSEVKDLSAEEFFTEVLIKKLKARLISCGDNYRFGKKAMGDISLLQKLCEKYGVILKIAEPRYFENELISATRIRTLIKSGETEKANKMLGRLFSFSGEVIYGNQIGRNLGFPTANIALPRGFVTPKFGVYASKVIIEEKEYLGVTNIGVKPTVGSDKVLAETWIQGFDGDIYGEKIRLILSSFIREEKKFGSLNELKEQVFKDAECAKRSVI